MRNVVCVCACVRIARVCVPHHYGEDVAEVGVTEEEGTS